MDGSYGVMLFGGRGGRWRLRRWDGGCGCSFDVWRVGGLGRAGQRLRSGAFAPDCPVVILVAACGRCLRIPSGLSTPRAPQATHAPDSSSCALTSAGENGLLGVPTNVGVVVEDLARPAPCRPRGRPRGAYAASCVVALCASRVGDAADRVRQMNGSAWAARRPSY
mgnify:CR=1 FL=1